MRFQQNQYTKHTEYQNQQLQAILNKAKNKNKVSVNETYK